MKILVTNDDGYLSASYRALIDELAKSFEVLCVAPDGERSWIGKSMTTLKELTIGHAEDVHGRRLHFLSGTPADCVQVGLYHLAKEHEIDAVVSGMNLGRNDGISRILSSGTVGAAFEGALAGIKSFAVSVSGVSALKGSHDFFDENNKSLFAMQAQIATKIIEKSLQSSWQNFQVLSLNVPLKANHSTAIAVTKPSQTYYGKLFDKKDTGYKFELPGTMTDMEPLSDLYSLDNGHVSLSPLCLELGQKESMQEVQKLLRE